jgi:hypothetical protein
MKSVILRKEATQNLAGGALAYSYEFTRDGYLDDVRINFSAACSQAVTITFNSKTHANYDVILKSETLSAAVDFYHQPARPIFFQKGDALDIGITSGGAAVAYMTALISEVDTFNA